MRPPRSNSAISVGRLVFVAVSAAAVVFASEHLSLFAFLGLTTLVFTVNVVVSWPAHRDLLRRLVQGSPENPRAPHLIQPGDGEHERSAGGQDSDTGPEDKRPVRPLRSVPAHRVAAGWYDDPNGGEHERLWNGAAWTAHIRRKG